LRASVSSDRSAQRETIRTLLTQITTHSPRESMNARGNSPLTRDTGFEEQRRKNNGKPSSLLDSHRGVALCGLMETNEAFREPIRRQQQLVNWSRLATNRPGEAQNERIWAVVKAYQSGLSTSSIAATKWLSTSRVQQLLGSSEAWGGAGSARTDTGRSAGAASGTTNEFSSDVSRAK
jgi:hypothetical protein